MDENKNDETKVDVPEGAFEGGAGEQEDPRIIQFPSRPQTPPEPDADGFRAGPVILKTLPLNQADSVMLSAVSNFLFKGPDENGEETVKVLPPAPVLLVQLLRNTVAGKPEYAKEHVSVCTIQKAADNTLIVVLLWEGPVSRVMDAINADVLTPPQAVQSVMRLTTELMHNSDLVAASYTVMFASAGLSGSVMVSPIMPDAFNKEQAKRLYSAMKSQADEFARQFKSRTGIDVTEDETGGIIIPGR